MRRLSARSGELSATLSDEELSLGATAADYSISAQELSATKREAVLSPWKLLGTPDEAARRRAAAVDAVRAYAEAATQHRIAMKGVEDALRRDEPLLAKDPALATLLRSRLEAANALFESRLAGMEDVLLGPAREAEAPPGQRP